MDRLRMPRRREQIMYLFAPAALLALVTATTLIRKR